MAENVLPPTEKQRPLLLFIGRYFNEHKQWPATREMAAFRQVTQATISDMIGSMRNRGLIVTPRGRKSAAWRNAGLTMGGWDWFKRLSKPE